MSSLAVSPVWRNAGWLATDPSGILQPLFAEKSVSASAFIAFLGLRFQVGYHEVAGLEERIDPRQIEARRVGLKTYWGNFGSASPEYLLFVGSPLGSFGLEGMSSLSLTPAELTDILEQTRSKLASTTITGDVAMHIQFQAD